MRIVATASRANSPVQSLDENLSLGSRTGGSSRAPPLQVLLLSQRLAAAITTKLVSNKVQICVTIRR